MPKVKSNNITINYAVVGPTTAYLATLPGLKKEDQIAAAMSDESKLMAPLTMESIADSVLAEGLASHAEVDRLIPVPIFGFSR